MVTSIFFFHRLGMLVLLQYIIPQPKILSGLSTRNKIFLLVFWLGLVFLMLIGVCLHMHEGGVVSF